MLFAYEHHIARNLYEFTTYSPTNGICTHCMVSVKAVTFLGELYVLRIGANVVAKTNGSFLVFDVELCYHPGAIDAILHVAMHLAQERKSWGKKRFFIQV